MPFDQENFALPAVETDEVLSPDRLMATPDHMLAWLRSKHPDDIVTRNVDDGTCCIGATFMQQSGHPNVIFGGSTFGARFQEYEIPSWFRRTWESFPERTPVTAFQVINAITARRAALTPTPEK